MLHHIVNKEELDAFTPQANYHSAKRRGSEDRKVTGADTASQFDEVCLSMQKRMKRK
jgi:hypothetical protein